jgi:hypothetical protein
MTPNFEYIAAVLDDYCDMQTSGFIPTANRYPVADVQEQVELLGGLQPVSNITLANRISELEREVSMHRNAEITWEQTMMQAVGEDGPKSVVEAIETIKAERDTAWCELREIREAISANPEESTADEVRRVVAERDALAAQVEALRIDEEAIEGCLAWLSEHEQTLDVGEGHIESTAGFLTRYLKNLRSVTPAACLARVRAEAVIKAANECNKYSGDFCAHSDLVNHANRIQQEVK